MLLCFLSNFKHVNVEIRDYREPKNIYEKEYLK